MVCRKIYWHNNWTVPNPMVTLLTLLVRGSRFSEWYGGGGGLLKPTHSFQLTSCVRLQVYLYNLDLFKIELTCKKSDPNIKNWLRFWYLKTLLNRYFASGWLTKSHTTWSVFRWRSYLLDLPLYVKNIIFCYLNLGPIFQQLHFRTKILPTIFVFDIQEKSRSFGSTSWNWDEPSSD